jgi:hypothetical protein
MATFSPFRTLIGLALLAPGLAFAPTFAGPLLLMVGFRYDKLARSFPDALHIAAIRRCLRDGTLQTKPSFELCRRLQSIRANICSRAEKNCRHLPLALPPLAVVPSQIHAHAMP